MAHIHITTKSGGGYSVTVDGIEISKQIYARGFGVEFPEECELPPVVSMLVPADVLDIDLPEAVVVALRANDEAVAL